MHRAFNYLFNQIAYGFILFPAIILICFSCEVCHAQEATPQPTPADGSTAEEYYNYILEQSDMESWVETNYDPVTTRNGECIRPKDMIYQSASADLAVVCTYGYENIYYDGGSGDIRGLNCQGFIGIEGTVVAFRLMDLFVSTAYGANDISSVKWKEVKAIKKLSKLQKKPQKPKKVKWAKADGLKEKKAELTTEVAI